MTRSMLGPLCLVLLVGAAGEAGADPVTVPGFRLTEASGSVVEVAAGSDAKWTVVCFLGTECPLARKYAPRLKQLAADFPDVRFVGVDSNLQDSPGEIAAYVKELGITFPMAKDPQNKVSDQFGAQRISEVVVLDRSLAIRYRGRIDDQYQPGVSRSRPTRDDLRIALEELRAGKRVSVPTTDASGCAIGRVKTPVGEASVTFCKQVARVLNQHCVECHRPGEIGPFSLTDYADVTGWGDTILQTIDAGRMPPWNARPDIGHFRNARSMSDADKQVLRDWVDAGMPYGEEKDLPPRPEFATGWQLPRTPDLIIPMRDRPYKVPEGGTVEYQYFVVDPHFDEDRWVSAAQVIPGSRPTVHHCIVFIRPPDGADLKGVGYLVGYVPGQRSFVMPTGAARKVPAGSKFVFQMHYTPNGVAEEDLTQLGMTFVPESEVTHEVFTLMAIDQEFEIPPHAADHAVNAEVRWLPKQAELLAIVPHMHVRGKAFEAFSRSGDRREPLLDVPRYDFNWQHVYELAEPLPLDGIDGLEMTVRFDNSKANPANPDPSQTVTWGDQTWEEMAIAFFEVTAPRSDELEFRSTRKTAEDPDTKNVDNRSVTEFVDNFFKQFDHNHDQVVETHETSLAFRRYAFSRFDENQDGKLSRDEIQAAAQRQRKKR